MAALYDIHGNLPALRAVLAEVEEAGVDVIVVGGDVVSGPLPAETLDVLASLGARARYVRGNTDRNVVAAYDGSDAGPATPAATFAAARISPAQRDTIAAYEPTLVIDVDGLGPTLFCHGSPRSDTEIITTATTDERLRAILGGIDQATIVGGHTHRQFDRHLDDRRIVNAGSVGIPYEGRPGAYWALLGPDVELRRTEYDLTAALAELRAGGFPDLDELLAESLLDPLDPDEVAAIFESQVDEGPGRRCGRGAVR